VNKLILGTVQFGLKYGINSINNPSLKEVFEILQLANDNNINTLDTADAYGDSITRIGKFIKKNNTNFNIITKFKYEDEIDISSLLKDTLEKLHTPSIEAYLYHSFDDFIKYPFIKDELFSFKEKKNINKIGISIYTNEEFEKAIDANFFDLIQFPYNLLDNNLQRGKLIKKAKGKNILLHARSVFLQGLFFKDLNLLPTKLLVLKPYLSQVHALSVQNNISISELALLYVLNNPSIDGVLIGIDSKEQLLQNLQLCSKKLDIHLINAIDTLYVKETNLLNPVNWH
jgi:aryl-alcohol dehydrogenase-like predicted oxidoreductase